MIKGPINEEDVTILNVYAASDRASKLMKQKVKDLQEEIEKPTIVRYLNTPSLNN